MPNVRAIFVADLHLQAHAPPARSSEKNWYAAMQRPLDEIAQLSNRFACPVLYAGDIFDRWDSRPEVINFALNHLPPGYAVPGQHDLPNHAYNNIQKSAYWTLVHTGKLKTLTAIGTEVGENIKVYGFPWGEPVIAPKKLDPSLTHIALAHQFIWCKGTGYPGAPLKLTITNRKKALAGFDVAVFGDNHKGFIRKAGSVIVCNCGSIMRRKIDERTAKPFVGMLTDDGEVLPHFLDQSQDSFSEATDGEKRVGTMLDMTEIVNGLRNLTADEALDFPLALTRFFRINKVNDSVQNIIIQACERGGPR